MRHARARPSGPICLLLHSEGGNIIHAFRYTQQRCRRTGFSEPNPIGDELVRRDHAWGVKKNFVHCVRHFVLPPGADLLVASQDYATK